MNCDAFYDLGIKILLENASEVFNRTLFEKALWSLLFGFGHRKTRFYEVEKMTFPVKFFVSVISRDGGPIFRRKTARKSTQVWSPSHRPLRACKLAELAER